MIIGYDESTFGKKGQVWSKTICYIRCDHCQKKEWTTTYNNKKRRDHDYCQSCKNILGISGMKGKKYSEESKQRRREKMLENNPMKNPENRKKISNALKGRSVPWLSGRKKPDHAKKMSEHMKNVWSSDGEYKNSLQSHLNKMKIDLRIGHSKLHSKFKQTMIKIGMENFKSEERIGKYVVDEVNYDKKIIIEVYGDYWHCNPLFYQSGDIVSFPGRKSTAQEIWDRDMERERILSKFGYKVIVVWEYDIKHSLKNVKEVLKNAYC